MRTRKTNKLKIFFALFGAGMQKRKNRRLRNQPRRIQELTPPGPKIPPFQSDKNVSPESTNPKEMAISPKPFSLFSSSSRSLKFRGTITVSPAGVFCMMDTMMLCEKRGEGGVDQQTREILFFVCQPPSSSEHLK